MATITRRGNRWSVQIRRKGQRNQSKTFSNRADAKAWAAIEEARIERGDVIQDRSMLSRTTLADIILRYISDVSPAKRGAESEILRLKKITRDAIGEVSLANLSSCELAAYRDRRLRLVKSATVHRELALMSHAIDVARREWGVTLANNPVKLIRKPSANASRERRLDPGEYRRIVDAAQSTRNPAVVVAIQLAIETALRRGELLGLHWENVDLQRRVADIPFTKTGVSRSIPLTDKAVQLLENQSRKEGVVLSITGNALRKSWSRIVERAGIQDLRFHDLRHEGISRFFEMGLSLPEVALISGHRDPRMLLKYTQLRSTDLAQKLVGVSWVNGTKRMGE